MLERETHRTFTLNKNYGEIVSLMEELYNAKKTIVKSNKVDEIKNSLSRMGREFEIHFVDTLLTLKDVKNNVKHSAAIEILIKFRSYFSIALERISDQIALMLYSGLIVSPCKEMKKWLSVKRPTNHESQFETEENQFGISLSSIVEVMRPSNHELEEYRKLKEKEQAINKAIQVIKRLD